MEVDMDFYYSTECGNSKRVLFTLAELGAPVTRHPLDLTKHENRSAEYLSVNPLGKVPALIDGSLVLWESNAIALYLAEKYSDKKLLPDSLQGRADLNRWLFYLAYEVAPPAWQYFFAKRRGETNVGEEKLVTAFPPLEARLEDSRYLLGEFSLADIAYAPSLANLRAAGFQLSRWPRIASWAAAVLARPAWGEATRQSA
jgi:glutathione S-transferase